MLNGNSLAVRRIERFIYIVDVLCVRIVERVQLQNHMLGQTGSSRRDTTCSSQVYMIVVTYFLNVAHLKDSPVNISLEAIAKLLCHMTQVQVVIGDFTQVDVLAEIGIGGVRSTIKNSLGIGQVAISALSC